MSTIKTNTLTGTSTAGSILVTGEGGSTTTNLQQGLAKVWCNIDGTAVDGTADLTGVNDSFNIASVVDNGTGDYTYAFQNVMSNANYSFSAAVRGDSTSNDNIFNADQAHSFSASQLIMRNRDVSASQDSEQACIQVFGDLA
tara:strand:- start:273 stop:698 length:426 start_codon:yes stop_codon:yes gene_type:complete